MRWRSFHPPYFFRIAGYGALLLLLLFWWEVSSVHQTLKTSKEASPSDPRHERIFITSILWNKEELLRSIWIPSLLELIQGFGRENVFVSVYASGGYDDTVGALAALDKYLGVIGVRRQILMHNVTHLDEISQAPSETGWVLAPDGSRRLRRIPYLARSRNIALEPLFDLNSKVAPFDKILFLNDVAFQPKDVRRLLNTRDGQYAAACSLDFSQPPNFYDTFALRDASGHAATMQRWPYFRDAMSRSALIAGQPVPVQSCWNGMVAMDAYPFYQNARLAFRGIPDSLAQEHLEGSECCLIHADNPLSSVKGVWLNPNVRVGYDGAAYESVNPSQNRLWVSRLAIAQGLSWNWLRRWTTTDWFKESSIERELAEWSRASVGNVEPGKSCIIREMQVLEEHGWEHL